MAKVRRISSGWTTGQAAKLAGLPSKTLATWIERGIVEPRVSHGMGPGGGYRYTDADVIGLGLLSRLRRDGVPLQRIRPMLKQLRKHTGQPNNLQALANSTLLFMGGKLYVVGSGDELMDLLTGQIAMQAVVCPPLLEILAEIRERAEQDDTLKQRVEASKFLRAA